IFAGTYMILFKSVNSSRSAIRSLLSLITVGVTSFNLSAFFIMPYFLEISEYYPFIIIQRIWDWPAGHVIFVLTHCMLPPHIIVLTILGMLACFVKRECQHAFLLASGLILLTISMGTSVLYPMLKIVWSTELDDILFSFLIRLPLMYSRYLVALRTIACALAAIGLSFLCQIVLLVSSSILTFSRKYIRIPKPTTLRRFSLTSFFLLILVVGISIYNQIEATDLGYGLVSDRKKILLSSDFEGYPYVVSIMNYISTHVPTDVRVLLQDTYGNFANYPSPEKVWAPTILLGELFDNKTLPTTSHIFALTPMYSRKCVVGSWCKTNYVAQLLSNSENMELLGFNLNKILNTSAFALNLSDRMRKLGIGYIVSCSWKLTSILEAYPQVFVKCYSNKYFNVFHLEPIPSMFKLQGEGEVQIVSFENDRILLQLKNLSKEAELDVKMIYYPNWRASINGTAVPIKKLNTLGLPFMKLIVPPGSNLVELRFYESQVAMLGKTVTLFQLMICLTIFIVERRPKLIEEAVFRIVKVICRSKL
ncbi:MAG: hypothetical protein QXQ11_08490, partial [Candidatus Bathyarchaeia archaeon]